VYKAFTTQDLKAAILGIRALGIRGCAVSMPFKEACIEFTDELDASAAAIDSVNTIVNDQGHLKAYNTDYIAVRALLETRGVPKDLPFALLGSGGMAKAVACALGDAGFRSGTIVARNAEKGRALADVAGFSWSAELGSLRPALLINVTPIGMSGGVDTEALAFDERAISRAEVVFDVVAFPAETPLIRAARASGKQVISGAEVIALQAVEQFALYTGVRPGAALIARAAAFASPG
jgi:shikimate dehydrogenase